MSLPVLTNVVQKIEPILAAEAETEYHFFDIEKQIMKHLHNAQKVTACHYVLTNKKIIAQLCRIPEVCICIYSVNWSERWYRHIDLLEKLMLKNRNNRHSGVLQVGHHKKRSDRTQSLMHSKFTIIHDESGPYKVLVGSYNMSHNANRNIENLSIIHSRTVAEHFQRQFEAVRDLSREIPELKTWVEQTTNLERYFPDQ